MTYLYLCMTFREAADIFKDFCYENQERIKNTKPYMLTAYFINGDEHVFMGEISYPQWCKGKIYYLNERLYHSGYLINDNLKGE